MNRQTLKVPHQQKWYLLRSCFVFSSTNVLDVSFTFICFYFNLAMQILVLLQSNSKNGAKRENIINGERKKNMNEKNLRSHANLKNHLKMN